MTKKDKDLLLKDLCARLPYGVNLQSYNSQGNTFDFYIGINTSNAVGKLLMLTDNCKPYLRPMSSMTEEEKEELKSKCIHTETEEDWEGVRCDVWGILILDKYDTRRWDNPIWPSVINMDAIDWLNAHHFDYRGLIEKGLALKAPKGMYNVCIE